MSHLDIAVLTSAANALFAFLVFHVLLMRVFKAINMPFLILTSIVLGVFLNGFSFNLVLEVSGINKEIPLRLSLFSAVLSVTLYALLVFHYIAWIFGMSEAAIRIRLLFEVGKKPHGGVKVGEILEHYNAATILEVRLKRLVTAGHIRFDGSRYQIKISPLLIQLWLMKGIMKLLGADREDVPGNKSKREG